MTQRLVKPTCGKSFSVAWVALASGGAARGEQAWRCRRARSCRRSLRVCTSHGEPALIVAGSSRMPGSSSTPALRNGGSALFRWRSAGRASSSVGASCWMEAERLVDSAASAPAVVLKFVIRSLSDPSVDASLVNTSRCAADQVREVVRMLAQERLVHDRASCARLTAVAEGLVDPLAAGQALDDRVLGGVLGGRRLLVERLAVAGQRPLQAAPGVLLQRGQDLVDLHGGRGLRDRDRRPARQVRRRSGFRAGGRGRSCPPGTAAGGW